MSDFKRGELYVKKIITLNVVTVFVFLLFCITASAAPVWDEPYTVTQPDGEEIECYISGDEFFNYVHDGEGYLVKENEETGYYVYVGLRDKEIVTGNNVVTEQRINDYADLDRITAAEYFAAREKYWVKLPEDFRNDDIRLIYWDRYNYSPQYDRDTDKNINQIDLGDTGPVIIGNCTMVPFRAFVDDFDRACYGSLADVESMKNVFSWDGNLKEVNVAISMRGYRPVSFRVGDNRAYIDGRECYLAVAPVNINGSVYVPLRFAAEAVDWGEMEVEREIGDGCVNIWIG